MSCVLKNSKDIIADFSKVDNPVLLAGVYVLFGIAPRTNKPIAAPKRQLKRFIDRNQHTNVVVVSLFHHYHEHWNSFPNKDDTVVGVSSFLGHLFTKLGQHLNNLGKRILCDKLSNVYKKATMNRGTSPSVAAAISNHLQVESPTDDFSFRGESPSAIASNFHNFQAVTKSADVPNLQLMCSPCKWKLLHRVIIQAAHDRAIHTQVTRRLSKSRHRFTDSHGSKTMTGALAVLRLHLTLLDDK
ncbi:hypothetical protein J6590_089420 [Homalodisca vitripennis]|nr:hypothetical protein J6590_089420 [Homalodisca vitripennis]